MSSVLAPEESTAEAVCAMLDTAERTVDPHPFVAERFTFLRDFITGLKDDVYAYENEQARGVTFDCDGDVEDGTFVVGAYVPITRDWELQVIVNIDGGVEYMLNHDDDIDPRTVPLGSTRLTDASRTVDFVSYFHLAAESAVRRAFDSLLTISEDAEAVGAL